MLLRGGASSDGTVTAISPSDSQAVEKSEEIPIAPYRYHLTYFVIYFMNYSNSGQ